MGPKALAQVLRPLRSLFKSEEHPNLIVGLEISDDAAVYRVSDEVAVIQTVDFFTPIVDDPYDYGAIAAANSMSDVYAMGGEVVLALNVCGFPQSMPRDVIAEILRGGGEKVLEAGGALGGGHTIDDKEPKYGLSVMGLVHPEHVLTKGGASPGDILVLTKPLGIGIITTASKGEAAKPVHIAQATESMKKLNRFAAQAISRVGTKSCTDITGFGLLGHGFEMADHSGVRLRFLTEELPFLPGAEEYAGKWLFPGGARRNQECYEKWVDFGPQVTDDMKRLLFTPETSGGLLAAVPQNELKDLTRLFVEAGQEFWVVGEVVEGKGIEVR